MRKDLIVIQNSQERSRFRKIWRRRRTEFAYWYDLYFYQFLFIGMQLIHSKEKYHHKLVILMSLTFSLIFSDSSSDWFSEFSDSPLSSLSELSSLPSFSDPENSTYKALLMPWFLKIFGSLFSICAVICFRLFLSSSFSFLIKSSSFPNVFVVAYWLFTPGYLVGICFAEDMIFRFSIDFGPRPYYLVCIFLLTILLLLNAFVLENYLTDSFFGDLAYGM